MNDFEKMKAIISQAENLIEKRVTRSNPEFEAWHTKTERFLNNKFGTDSIEVTTFKKRLFSPTVYALNYDRSIDCVRDLQTTILELTDYLDEGDCGDKVIDKIATYSNNKVFIVHGHDGELKEALARLLEAQNITPIILSEQANKGKTIIEKFEAYSDVGAAITLFTTDDLGKAKDNNELKPRARQNVIFEAGYFMGKLGRDKVVVVAEDEVEIPSDLQGVVYTGKSDWKLEVCRELKAIGYSIDFNKLF